MHAALELETRIRALALDHEADLLETAQLRFVSIDDFDAKAAGFGVHRIHSIQNAREQRRFLAAGARTDLHDHAAFVVRVFRQQQNFQFFL